jgi:hypothetical protein
MTAEEMAALIDGSPPGPWPDGWAGWDCVRDAHILLIDSFIQRMPEYPVGQFGGRGIVSCVSAKPGMSSGKDLAQGYFPGAWVMVKELRRLGCTLPITFAHYGPLEWDSRLSAIVAREGVEVVDLAQVEEEHPCRIMGGWETKAFSTVWSRYEEVLFLDADNIPLRDPSFLFDASQYKYTGSIFWPDCPPYDRQEWLPECVWRNMGLAYRDEVDFESGQYVINKRKCWRELLLAEYLNQHSDYFYRFIFGDKSTFHLAWAKLSSNWSIPQRGPGGNQASLIQHDFMGNPLFQHCTRNKPTIHGYGSPGSLLNSDQCHVHLAELRQLWDGRMWENGQPTEAEEREANALIGKVFEYERLGLDKRPMRLLADQRIGRGLAKLEVGWSIYIDARGPMMAITSLEGVLTALLRPDGSGSWSGRWTRFERCKVTLKPIPE